MAARQSYIDWLKSLGCVVYLPMSSDGDLVDRISGNSLVSTGVGSYSWTADGYEIETPSSITDGVLELPNAVHASLFADDCFTTLTTFRKITTSGIYGFGQIGILSNTETLRTALSPAWNATGQISGYPATTIHLARYEGQDERIFYQNGAVYTTLAPATSILPSSWSQINDNFAVGVTRANNTNYYGKQFNISEVYVFNKKLTLDQIRTIQGY